MGARFRIVTAVALVAVGAVGCGRSAGGNEHVSQPLSNVLLQQDDFPDGWSSVSHIVDPAVGTRHAKLARCLGIPDSAPHANGSLTSDDYTLEGTRVWSTVTRFPSKTDVTKDIDAVRGSKFHDCEQSQLKDLVSKNLPSAFGLKSFKLTVHLSPSRVPHNVAAIASAHFTAKAKHSDASVDGYIDIAFISGPDIEATITINASKNRLDPDIQTQIITAVANRAAAIAKKT